MTTAIYFVQFGECFRCHGFRNAFSTFRVADGKCLRCGGTLREYVRKPIAEIDAFCGASRRADSIKTLAKCLSLVGAPIERDANGKKVSAWGFVQWCKGDNERAFAAELTTAPDDVRVRAWAAFTRKVRETMPEKGDAPAGYIKRLVAQMTGLSAEDVPAWLGETAEAAKAA